jgi:UDP-N-acetylglucosamine 2-epimerase (non-hydrolysing)
MNIVIVAGARPNFIKVAPIIKALNEKSIGFTLVHTGQHYDYEMSKIFFRDLDIPEPDIHLGVGSGTHAEQTGRILIEFEKVLLNSCPDLVLVVGDVNSTLAGALAAVKLHIPIAHVEAGVRSNDMTMPEEVNRVLVDHCSTLLFCPTKNAVTNLAKEGIVDGVYLTGDVMVDTLLSTDITNSDILARLELDTKDYFLATIHRQSNTDNLDNLTSILSALEESNEPIIFPVHPRTRKALEDFYSENVMLINPLGYIDFLQLMAGAKKVLTDSGGVQKEAYLLGVPCITLRDTTEWVETLGWNILVGADRAKILDAIRHFSPSGSRSNIFGNGDASTKICTILDINYNICNT